MSIITVAGVVKPTVAQASRGLSGLGMEVGMLTGNIAKTTRAIQRQVGVNRVAVKVFPQGKEREVQRLQENGKKVAMIGDGINDAPRWPASRKRREGQAERCCPRTENSKGPVRRYSANDRERSLLRRYFQSDHRDPSSALKCQSADFASPYS